MWRGVSGGGVMWLLVVGWIDCSLFGKECVISMSYLMILGRRVGFEGAFDDG